MNTTRKTYPSDLNDQEWAYLEAFIPAAKSGGRPSKYSRREIVNAILYVLRAAVGGCYRMIFHPGKVSTDTSDAGVKRAFGSVCMTTYATAIGKPSVAILVQVPEQSIVSR